MDGHLLRPSTRSPGENGTSKGESPPSPHPSLLTLDPLSLMTSQPHSTPHSSPHSSPLPPHSSLLIPYPSPLTPCPSPLTPHSTPSPLTSHPPLHTPSPLTPHPSLHTLTPHPSPLTGHTVIELRQRPTSHMHLTTFHLETRSGVRNHHRSNAHNPLARCTLGKRCVCMWLCLSPLLSH